MATPGMTTASGTSSPIAVNGVYDKSCVGLFKAERSVGIGSSGARDQLEGVLCKSANAMGFMTLSMPAAAGQAQRR
ncbi:hypothetical protein [Dyella lipolytica]|uniref:Uncharacterized protein n=1 Tax=Dyella lipolytica TaxID=1867835 RepID=A0ABW8IT09_9GAMM|nr:hypothetical protein [Dyella lipolytica]